MSTSEVKILWYIPEILRHIHKYSNLPDFAALCQTSKVMHHVGHELLYESIYLDLPKRSGGSLPMLCRTLKEKSILPLRVKDLRVQLWGSRVPPRAKSYEDHSMQQPSQSLLLSEILDLCSDLEIISITCPYPVPSLVTLSVTRAVSTSQHLRELEFIVTEEDWPPHIPGQADVNVPLLPHALRNKSLTSISMTVQQRSLLFSSLMTIPSISTIIRLSLDQAYLSMELLSNILSVLLYLKHLSLSFLCFGEQINLGFDAQLDCKKLFLALERRASTLESLKIAFEFNAKSQPEFYDAEMGIVRGNFSDRKPLHSLDSLQSFPKLELLHLPPEIICGWEKDGGISLRELLPVPLRDLHFRWDFGRRNESPWKFDALWELLAAYLDPAAPPHLRSLVLTCHDPDESTCQKSFELIERRCKELKIDCSLEIVQHGGY